MLRMTSAGAARENSGSPGRWLEGKTGGGAGGALHSVGPRGRQEHGAPAAARPFRRLQAVTDVPLRRGEGRPAPARAFIPRSRRSAPRVSTRRGAPREGCPCRKSRPSRPLGTGAPCAARAPCPTAPRCALPPVPRPPCALATPVPMRPSARPPHCRPHPRHASASSGPHLACAEVIRARAQSGRRPARRGTPGSRRAPVTPRRERRSPGLAPRDGRAAPGGGAPPSGAPCRPGRRCGRRGSRGCPPRGSPRR
jgi:hypothetical protein